jgi:hypothetical protein
MSFTLLDQGAENFEFTSNVWHWKAALEIIRGLDIIDESRVRQLGYNAMGTKMDIDEARLIGEKIRDEILPKVAPGHRMFADGTVTDAPDDGTFYKDNDEEWKNYSVGHDWLKDFSDFCLRSKGFQVF